MAVATEARNGWRDKLHHATRGKKMHTSNRLRATRRDAERGMPG